MAGTRYGGIDWGFHNPFGALEAVLDHDDVLWVHWERCATRTALTDHSKAMSRAEITWYADPAGADQIAEMRISGHHVVPCVHLGQQPMMAGIAQVTDRIRSGRLKVLGSLGNTIDEAGKYRYDKETEKPLDQDNHMLAALRYMIVGIDRGRAVKDQAPGETEGQKIVRLATVSAQREAAHDDWQSVENPAWWGGAFEED